LDSFVFTVLALREGLFQHAARRRFSVWASRADFLDFWTDGKGRFDAFDKPSANGRSFALRSSSASFARLKFRTGLHG
jgi:hypothetical protein